MALCVIPDGILGAISVRGGFCVTGAVSLRQDGMAACLRQAVRMERRGLPCEGCVAQHSYEPQCNSARL